ncbi:tRNA pseudouridine(38-40) synthase TruA [Salinicoccus halodurans]|uniref:tRNA pseudouridine synthase A n=1 Tax=Salinicoccus halodurans TaxID=407035 RepID=A0A0F7HHM8_9STAP|nr:tRNA pseudouridine(38-40) synthase TruA [Salinicoccus halodurans]AKG73008.1 pseudouridine synthase [Salinicoccus halodurans]SFK77335.1 tRNA pseudouridine38-40 synthase [Salinicoccus halodurans]
MRYLVKVSYNGSKFSGFQYQKDARTVQNEIESVLNRMHKEFVRIHPAGRTDAGVHALEQYFHFDSHIDIPGDKWKFALNSGLPEDILIHEVREIDEDYHVRFHSKGKTYRYKIYQGTNRDPFQHGLKVYYPYQVDEQKMRDAMQYFIGTHDFTSFSSAKSEIENKVRHIHRFDLIKTEEGFDFVITGSGFLYNMVRILVAYVLEVGQGRWDGGRTPEILEAKDRKHVPRTAPAEGLYLERVFLNEKALEETLQEMKNNLEKH